MRIEKTECFEEVTVLLEEGIDYANWDVVPDRMSGGRLKHINPEKLAEISQEHGYTGWSWSGFCNVNCPGTYQVKFRRVLE